MPGSVALSISRWFWMGLDWIYPPSCAGCRARGERWCPACQEKVRRIEPPLCPKCGQSQPEGKVCPSCGASPPHFTALRAWSIFEGPVRQAVHELKYKRNMALGEVFASQMASFYRTLDWQIDSVLPVPLGIARLAERGYNQAALLARPLAWGLGVSYRPGALKRVRETRSQVDLNAMERRKNVSGAFQAAPDAVRGRRFLLVDDVATTGSTLDACAVALLESGAEAVFALTLARAQFSQYKQPAN